MILSHQAAGSDISKIGHRDKFLHFIFQPEKFLSVSTASCVSKIGFGHPQSYQTGKNKSELIQEDKSRFLKNVDNQ